MITDTAHLVFALVLLWLPRPFLRVGRLWKRRRRHRSGHPATDVNPKRIREPGDKSVDFRTEFAKGRNYVDFVRAALGSVLLLGLAPVISPAIEAAADADVGTGQRIYFARLAVLVIAVLIQSFRFDGRVTMFAPLFFVTGLAIGVCGLYAAGFALVLIWTINLALPNPTAFLSVYALVILVFGTLFLGVNTAAPLSTAALAFLPVLVSLLIRRPLVLFATKTRTEPTIARP
ncbi:MAG TPA: hypothetical protein VHE13_09065 [Opitutus sp.]|nr:hypothetical protein [Opitutus sp.]